MSYYPKDVDLQGFAQITELSGEDRTPFEAIETQFNLKEKQVITVMRKYMKSCSFKMWCKRVTKRKTKHLQQRDFLVVRFKSSNQKT